MKTKKEIQMHIDRLEKDLEKDSDKDQVSDFYERGKLHALRWMIYEDPIHKANKNSQEIGSA